MNKLDVIAWTVFDPRNIEHAYAAKLDYLKNAVVAAMRAGIKAPYTLHLGGQWDALLKVMRADPDYVRADWFKAVEVFMVGKLAEYDYAVPGKDGELTVIYVESAAGEQDMPNTTATTCNPKPTANPEAAPKMMPPKCSGASFNPGPTEEWKIPPTVKTDAVDQASGVSESVYVVWLAGTMCFAAKDVEAAHGYAARTPDAEVVTYRRMKPLVPKDPITLKERVEYAELHLVDGDLVVKHPVDSTKPPAKDKSPDVIDDLIEGLEEPCNGEPPCNNRCRCDDSRPSGFLRLTEKGDRLVKILRHHLKQG